MVVLIQSRPLFCAFLPIFMLYHFLCDAKSPKLQLRAKRDFLPSGNSGPPCGCVSKYAPINCRCTSASGNSDELLCRCDRALVSSSPINREDSSRGGAGGGPMTTAQCGGNCRMPTGEPSLFRQGSHPKQQHGHGIYGYGGASESMLPVHSACHPICHKSCMHSCTSSRSTTAPIDSLNSFGVGNGGGFSPIEFHQQHNQPSMDSKAGTSNGNNCFPSQCRANCLRACARIFDAQQRHQQQNRENFVSNNGIENENDIDAEAHYQVEMGGHTKPNSPDNDNTNNMMGTGRNGCQCSPTPANVCECQESCYPICVDTCESNCLQQQMQQTPASQRAQCAQFCHLECQHDCAVEQQQQQQRVPARKAVETVMVESIDNGNNNWQSNGNPIAICAHKCPRACEQACQSAAQNGEPNSNCVPTCIGLCAQSCARGIQFDTVGLTQQMAVPMPAMALVDIADGGGTAQMPANFSTINGDIEFVQLQKQQHHDHQQQPQQINDWRGGGVEMAAPNFGQNDGPLVEFGNETPAQQQPNTPAIMPPSLAMEDVGQQEQAVLVSAPPGPSTRETVGGGIPCAPLCQPECRPECTKRYMEGRRGTDERTSQQQQQYGGPMMVVVNNGGMSNNGPENGGGKSGDANGIGANGQQPIGTDQQSQNEQQHQQQQQSTKQQRSAAAAPSLSFVPPHIILDDGVTATAYNDDEEEDGSNGTTKGRNNANDDRWQQQLDKMSWLRMRNETGTGENSSKKVFESRHQKQRNNNTKTSEVREQQKKTKDVPMKLQRKVPNSVKGEKRVVTQKGQHHLKQNHHHQQQQQLSKDGKIGRRANEIFRRRKVLFGGESKVSTKKMPKNGKETVEKVDLLKAVKREKSVQNDKVQQNATANKRH